MSDEGGGGRGEGEGGGVATMLVTVIIFLKIIKHTNYINSIIIIKMKNSHINTNNHNDKY